MVFLKSTASWAWLAHWRCRLVRNVMQRACCARHDTKVLLLRKWPFKCKASLASFYASIPLLVNERWIDPNFQSNTKIGYRENNYLYTKKNTWKFIYKSLKLSLSILKCLRHLSQALVNSNIQSVSNWCRTYHYIYWKEP